MGSRRSPAECSLFRAADCQLPVEVSYRSVTSLMSRNMVAVVVSVQVPAVIRPLVVSVRW